MTEAQEVSKLVSQEVADIAGGLGTRYRFAIIQVVVSIQIAPRVFVQKDHSRRWAERSASSLTAASVLLSVSNLELPISVTGRFEVRDRLPIGITF
ncbi:MAG: hypothetical protein AAGD38_16180 [Acidobacteriota bacterium]